MAKNQTLGILFHILKSKLSKDNKAPIYLRITVDGVRSEVSMNRYIEPEKWNPQAGYARGTKEDMKQLNVYIDTVRNQIYNHQKELISDGALITSESLKNKFLGISEKKITLTELIVYHNKMMDEKIGIDCAKATATRYTTVFTLIKLFLKHQYKANDYQLSQLNFEFISLFEHFLKTVRKCNHNTSTKYIRNFGKIINVAINNEWIARNPFAAFKTSILPVEREFLSEEDMQALETKKIKIQRLDAIRDIFVFSCYTGLAYADVSNLSPDNIVTGIDGDKWIYTHRQKTETKSNIPLLPKALEIIAKYKDHPAALNKGKILPVLSNQKMNAYLKEIADICEITKPLTFHIARHTFATTVTLTNGVPIESVSSMLGHKNIRTTQIYAKVVERKVSDDMKLLREKLISNKKNSTKKTGS